MKYEYSTVKPKPGLSYLIGEETNAVWFTLCWGIECVCPAHKIQAPGDEYWKFPFASESKLRV